MLLAVMCERRNLEQSAILTETILTLNKHSVGKKMCYVNIIQPQGNISVGGMKWLKNFFNTYSLCTKWFRRSCVISSCQLFLMPEAEGGPAVGMEPTPPASFIRLREKGSNDCNDYQLL